MKKLFFQRSVIIGAAVIAGLGALYAATLSPRAPRGQVIAISRGNIEQEILAEGSVKASREVDLSFDRGGKIAALPFAAGEDAPAGAVLAALENAAEKAALAEAEAQAAGAQAKLEELEGGNRPEEVAVKEAALEAQETVLQNALEKAPALLSDALGAAQESLSRYADALFRNGETDTPMLAFGAGTQAAYDAQTARLAARDGARMLAVIAAPGNGKLEEKLASALGALRAIERLFLALDAALKTGSGLSDATLADYRDKAATGRDKVVSSESSLQEELNAIREAQAARESAARSLALAKAPATAAQLEEARQAVSEAAARRRASEAALEKTVIRAPFAGQIARREGEAGETAVAGSPVVRLLGHAGFVIEANIPEADIGKLKAGDPADVTLDAFGPDARFAARLISIDPAEKVIDGVPTYKATFALESGASTPRPGMTANIAVRKTFKKDVLLAPQGAVTEKNGAATVQIVTGSGRQERQVKTGLRGEDGSVELLAGVAAGERVFVPQEKK